MEENRAKLDERLQLLVEALLETKKLYTTAAENALDDDLRRLFQARAGQRNEFVETIRQQKWTVEGDVVNGEEPLDILKRGSVTIRATMALEPQKTDMVLIEEIREADRALLDRYRETLSNELADPVKGRLERQYALVQAAQANLGTMLGTPDSQMVFGLFDTVDHAEQAVRKLEEAQYERQGINLLAQEEAVKSLVGDQDQRADTAKESAAAGAVGGGAVGGLLGLVAGASTALVMGVGTVLTGGALAAALGITAAGAGIGASYGGFLGALMGWGVSEGDVQHFIEGVRSGKILVAVETQRKRSELATSIMREAGASYVSTHQEMPES